MSIACGSLGAVRDLRDVHVEVLGTRRDRVVEAGVDPGDRVLREAHLLGDREADGALEALAVGRVAELPRIGVRVGRLEERRIGGVVGADRQLAGGLERQVLRRAGVGRRGRRDGRRRGRLDARRRGRSRAGGRGRRRAAPAEQAAANAATKARPARPLTVRIGRVVSSAVCPAQCSGPRQPVSGGAAPAGSRRARPSDATAEPWFTPMHARPYESSYSSGSPASRSPNVRAHRIVQGPGAVDRDRERAADRLAQRVADVGGERRQLHVAERVLVHDLGLDRAVGDPRRRQRRRDERAVDRRPERLERRAAARGARRPARTRHGRGTCW